MKLLLKFTFLFLAATLIMSCKTIKEIKTADLNNKWILKSINGSNVSESFPGKTPTIEFDIAKSRVTGNSGCNNYNGSYTLTGNKFSAPNLASTRMACVNGGEEHTYLQLLSKSSEISINKNGELVFTQDGKTVLVFEVQSLTAETLKGEWVLQSIQGATANVHYKKNIPTINFNSEDMRVSGSTSCNNYNSTFSLTNKKLTIERMITTRRACIDGMEGEAKFTELLSGESDIDLDNGLLILKRNGLHTLTFIRK